MACLCTKNLCLEGLTHFIYINKNSSTDLHLIFIDILSLIYYKQVTNYKYCSVKIFAKFIQLTKNGIVLNFQC